MALDRDDFLDAVAGHRDAAPRRPSDVVTRQAGGVSAA